MSKSIIRYCITFIFLCGTYLTKGQGSSVLFKKADSLFETGDYFEASICYEKIYFYSNDFQEMADARFKRAMCFKRTGDFERAYKQLMPLNPFGLTDSQFYLIKYELILNAYLSKEYEIARANYLLMQNYLKEDAYLVKLDYIYVLIAVDLFDFEEAKKTMLAMSDRVAGEAERLGTQEEIMQLFDRKNLPRIKNEKLANNLSMIIPGSGQIYSGFIGEGIFSFSLNAASLVLGAYGIYRGYYLTGYLVGFGLLSKLHKGNQQRTAELVRIRNVNEKIKFRENVILVLEKLLIP